MTLTTKRTVLSVGIFIISAVTLFGCQLISEKVFFDKFFYQKSISYGYIRNYATPPNITMFGERSKYLHNFDITSPQNSRISGVNQSSHTYKIVVIGDSYTWGVGLKNEQRFAYLLERKLNRLRPTEVISVAQPGWNISEYVKAYNVVNKSFLPNLYVFGLVSNDVLLNRNNLDHEDLSSCRKKNPSSSAEPIYSHDPFSTNPNISPPELAAIFDKLYVTSWSNPTNLCLLDVNINRLPKESTIYFLPDNYDSGLSSPYTTYLKHLNKFSKKTLSSYIARVDDHYRYLLANPDKNWLYVSQMERHPSALANQMYADILYDEIINNPQYKFKP